MARAQPAPLAAANAAKRAAADARRDRDVARRVGLMRRDLWSDEEIAAEEERLRAEIDQWIAEGRVTVLPGFGRKEGGGEKAAADVSYLVDRWVITDQVGGAEAA